MPRKRTCDPTHKSNHDRCLLNIPKTHLPYRLMISPWCIHLLLKSLWKKKKNVFSYCRILSVNLSRFKLPISHARTLYVGECSLHFHKDICLFPKVWIISVQDLIKHTNKIFPLSYLPSENLKALKYTLHIWTSCENLFLSKHKYMRHRLFKILLFQKLVLNVLLLRFYKFRVRKRYWILFLYLIFLMWLALVC